MGWIKNFREKRRHAKEDQRISAILNDWADHLDQDPPPALERRRNPAGIEQERQAQARLDRQHDPGPAEPSFKADPDTVQKITEATSVDRQPEPVRSPQPDKPFEVTATEMTLAPIPAPTNPSISPVVQAKMPPALDQAPAQAAQPSGVAREPETPAKLAAMAPPETTQRPSYEVETSAEPTKGSEIADQVVVWQRVVHSARDRLTTLGDRLELAFQRIAARDRLPDQTPTPVLAAVSAKAEPARSQEPEDVTEITRRRIAERKTQPLAPQRDQADDHMPNQPGRGRKFLPDHSQGRTRRGPGYG